MLIMILLSLMPNAPVNTKYLTWDIVMDYIFQIDGCRMIQVALCHRLPYVHKF